MARFFLILNLAICSAFATISHAEAQNNNLDALYELLRSDDLEDYEAVEAKIELEWSKSGSDAMDLLLDRGRRALEAGDIWTAIDHFTALTDHAPDFAEGWNARATAYFHADLFGPAMDDLEHALALNPRNFQALAGLGIVLREMGMTQTALEAFERAHELTPHRPDLVEAIAELEAELGGFEL